MVAFISGQRGDERVPNSVRDKPTEPSGVAGRMVPEEGFMQSSRWGRRTSTVFALVIWASVAFAQQTPSGRGPAAASNVPPPLLFTEGWTLPPHEGAPTDENMRFTPGVVTNDRLEYALPDAGLERGHP
jgi:hypothetical protein